MYKNRIIAALTVLLLTTLSACNGGSDSQDVRYTGKLPELLHTVPSDALAVVCSERCSRAIGLLDSTHVFRKINYGKLKNAPAAISWGYNGSLVPVLSIEAGKHEADSESVAMSIIGQAERLHLFSEYFSPDKEAGRQGYIIITPSEAQLAAVSRHISEGRSIMDATDFETAARLSGGAGDFAVARCSGAARLVPRDFLSDIFPRRQLTAFLHSAADWVTLIPEAEGEYTVRLTRGDTDTYYTNLLSSLPVSESQLMTMLPETVEFAISLPVPGQEFREAYERYQDASVRLTSYSRNISALEKATGKNPLKWEKELGIREVGLISWEGNRIVLLRPEKAVADSEPEDNPYRGFTAALYGSAFALEDDSCASNISGWTVIGSRQAVEAFAACAQKKEIKWPSRNCHIAIYWHSNLMCWNKKEIKIWNSSQ